MIRFLTALLAAVLLTCAPAAAQLDTRTLPEASPLAGAERMPAVQGSGCTAKTTPCASVAVTPALLSAYLAPTFQPLDADLSAIAALSTQSFGRTLLTQSDAAAARTTIGLGSMATQAASSVAITGGAINGATIGATTPAAGTFNYLTVTGLAYLSSASTSASISFVGRSAGSNTWLFGSDNAIAGGTDQGLSLYTYGSNVLRLYTANAERVRLDAAGNLGIGVTAPAAKLHVAGTVLATRHCYTATVCDQAGAGSPAGVVSAGIGSTWRRTDGGAGSTFYVKESGTDATGWVAK